MSRPTVSLAGNATRDPELRFLSDGTANATFGLAVNSRKKDPSGNWVDGEPQFFDVICWRQLAENVVETITKGMRVVVVGELKQRSWENDAGEKRSKIEIQAEECSPSLRWATATVTRNEGSSGSGASRPASQQAAEPQRMAPEYDESPFVRDAGEWMPGAWGAYPESY